MGPSPGLFAKLLDGATALLLLALAFVFSVLVFSVLAVGLLGVLLRLAWVRRRVARARRFTRRWQSMSAFGLDKY